MSEWMREWMLLEFMGIRYDLYKDKGEVKAWENSVTKADVKDK